MPTATVTAEKTDGNDHMNVLRYPNRNSQAVDVLCGGGRELPARPAPRSDTTSPTSANRVRATRSRYTPESWTRSVKAVDVVSFLLGRQRERLSNTLETLLVHVDLEIRRATSSRVCRRGPRRSARGDRRARPGCPTCGPIRIRRRDRAAARRPGRARAPGRKPAHRGEVTAASPLNSIRMPRSRSRSTSAKSPEWPLSTQWM